ncbi:hypothetical protein LFREDSHE_18610 [Shewanella baltica]
MENMIFSNSYIICATPRSGSTLLCDLLTDTQVAGCPDSFFRREDFLEWASYFDVSVTNWGNEQEFDQSYLTAVLQEGTGGTSIFGMRLMWESLGELSKRLASFHPGLPNDNARFQAVFGSPRYVHLIRENKVAQAVSRLKAEQSGLWHLGADGTERERLKFGQAPSMILVVLQKLSQGLKNKMRRGRTGLYNKKLNLSASPMRRFPITL